MIVRIGDVALSGADLLPSGLVRDLQIHDDHVDPRFLHLPEDAQVGGRRELHRDANIAEGADLLCQVDPVAGHPVRIPVGAAAEIEDIFLRHPGQQELQGFAQFAGVDGLFRVRLEGAEAAFQLRLVIAADGAGPDIDAGGAVEPGQVVQHRPRMRQVFIEGDGLVPAVAGDTVFPLAFYDEIWGCGGEFLRHADVDIGLGGVDIHRMDEALIEKVGVLRFQLSGRLLFHQRAQAEQLGLEGNDVFDHEVSFR